ncbi:MAG: transposase [Saprospiraceae bacterium]
MKDKKTRKRRHYDAAFKSNILKMNEDGRSVPSLSEAFGISENLIYRWRSQANKSDGSTDNDYLGELKQLRKQLKEVEAERDILKKALGIFSRRI